MTQKSRSFLGGCSPSEISDHEFGKEPFEKSHTVVKAPKVWWPCESETLRLLMCCRWCVPFSF
jgi:hypothetical protein